MSLRRRKIRPKWFDHPALKAGNGLDPDDVDIIRFVVGQFVAAFGYSRLDDFVSEALLVYTISREKKTEHPNWRAYLTVRVDGALSRVLRRERKKKPEILTIDPIGEIGTAVDESVKFENELDTEIGKLLVAGYSGVEISKMLNVSTSMVSARKIAMVPILKARIKKG